MSQILFGAVAFFAAAFVYLAVCAPILTSREPKAILALAVGTILLIMYFHGEACTNAICTATTR